ncbi:hypothetical protein SHIRM173S_01827 [Streptomyces hirsutus]
MFGERLDPVILHDALAITKACQIFVAVGTAPGHEGGYEGKRGGQR